MIFELTEDESKKAREFFKNHKCSIGLDEYGFKKMGAIGGGETYSFTPTGLGNIIEVKCTCGKKLDLTDTDSW
jgi:hypothetical protein